MSCDDVTVQDRVELDSVVGDLQPNRQYLDAIDHRLIQCHVDSLEAFQKLSLRARPSGHGSSGPLAAGARCFVGVRLPARNSRPENPSTGSLPRPQAELLRAPALFFGTVQKRRVVAVFCGNAGADGSRVTINIADVPKFTQCKNIVFDMAPPASASVVEIKVPDGSADAFRAADPRRVQLKPKFRLKQGAENDGACRPSHMLLRRRGRLERCRSRCMGLRRHWCRALVRVG